MKQCKVIIEVSRNSDGELHFEIHPKRKKNPIRRWTKYRSAAMREAMCLWADLNCGLNESSGAAMLRMKSA